MWSASLRYAFMVLFLVTIMYSKGGVRQLRGVLNLFFSHWKFWIFSGSVGFGGFYALICFSADYSPGWVIAATWQFTIVASLFVLMLFGRSFPKRIWFFSALIFLGVALVNLSYIDHFDYKVFVSGGLPVFIAAFCYPLGNQMVWEAQNGNNRKLPSIKSPLLNNVFNKIFLMTLGSLPLWIALILFTHPPAPGLNQILNTSLVALFSGIFATGIFLFARNLASTSNELAGVDATQASEVVFALIGGVFFIGSKSPNMESLAGLLLIVIGLTCFVINKKAVE